MQKKKKKKKKKNRFSHEAAQISTNKFQGTKEVATGNTVVDRTFVTLEAVYVTSSSTGNMGILPKKQMHHFSDSSSIIRFLCILRTLERQKTYFPSSSAQVERFIVMSTFCINLAFNRLHKTFKNSTHFRLADFALPPPPPPYPRIPFESVVWMWKT